MWLGTVILETSKWVLWQTVKTQMKCSIMLHFTRVCTVCLKKYIIKMQNDNPILIVSILWENPSEYKGLICPWVWLGTMLLETSKWVLWQTVQTQMKYSIMLHFIRVCTVCLKKYIIKMQNEQSYMYCINMYGKIDQNAKGYYVPGCSSITIHMMFISRSVCTNACISAYAM